MKRNLFIYMLLPFSLLSCSCWGQNKADSVTTFGLVFSEDPMPGMNNYEIKMPNIKGLYTSDRWAYCPKDSCKAGFYVVGIRCPKNVFIRQWVSNKLWEETKSEGFKKKAPKGMVNNLEIPISEVTDFYLNQWKEGHQQFLNDPRRCEQSGKFSTPTEQFGLIITDVWQKDGYYTMCVHSWYDALSCGCPYKTSYYTLNASTGKEVKVDDILLKTDFPKVERLLRGKLAWMEKEWGELRDKNYLENCSGVALIKEGLLVYYCPYKICERQRNVIIPYSQLEKEGIKLVTNI